MQWGIAEEAAFRRRNSQARKTQVNEKKVEESVSETWKRRWQAVKEDPKWTFFDGRVFGGLPPRFFL